VTRNPETTHGRVGAVRRLALVVVALLVGAGAAVGLASIPDDEPDRFCAYGEFLFGKSPQEFGDLTLWADVPVEFRRPAGCEELWVRLDKEPDLYLFSESELSKVDGVMFEDCQISWVDGGRSRADDVGVPC